MQPNPAPSRVHLIRRSVLTRARAAQEVPQPRDECLPHAARMTVRAVHGLAALDVVVAGGRGVEMECHCSPLIISAPTVAFDTGSIATTLPAVRFVA